MVDLQNKVALTLARAGCNVAVNYLNAADAAREVVDEIEKLDRRAIAIQADVTAFSSVRQLVEKIECQLGVSVTWTTFLTGRDLRCNPFLDQFVY